MVPNAQSVGAVYNLRLTNCATLLCRACLDFPFCVAVRCLSVNPNISRNKRNGNPTAVPLFRSYCRSPVCARLGSKGQAGVQKRKKNRRLSFLFAPRRARRRPAEAVSRKANISRLPCPQFFNDYCRCRGSPNPRVLNTPPLRDTVRGRTRSGSYSWVGAAKKGCRPERRSTNVLVCPR